MCVHYHIHMCELWDAMHMYTSFHVVGLCEIGKHGLLMENDITHVPCVMCDIRRDSETRHTDL